MRGALLHALFQLEIQPVIFLLSSAAAGDGMGEKTGVKKRAVFAVGSAGIDKDNTQRAVAGPQSSFVVSQRIAAGQAFKHLLPFSGVLIKISRVSSHIVILGIAEQFHFGGVGPLDDAVGAQAHQTDRSPFSNIGQNFFFLTQRGLGGVSLRNRGGKGQCGHADNANESLQGEKRRKKARQRKWAGAIHSGCNGNSGKDGDYKHHGARGKTDGRP